MRVWTMIFAVGVSALGLVHPAAADPVQELRGAPGVPLPLAVETGARADCSVGQPPEMKVVVAPAHGELTLREGALRRRGSACPASPGYVVLYVPDDDFNGADMVTIQLIGGDDPATLAFDIQVKGKVAPPEGGV